MDISVAFGRSVKLRRTELDISQETLADQAGIARSFLSAIERGASQASIGTVWKLANALQCKPSDLWLTAEALYVSRLARPDTKAL